MALLWPSSMSCTLLLTDGSHATSAYSKIGLQSLVYASSSASWGYTHNLYVFLYNLRSLGCFHGFFALYIPHLDERNGVFLFENQNLKFVFEIPTYTEKLH